MNNTMIKKFNNDTQALEYYNMINAVTYGNSEVKVFLIDMDVVIVADVEIVAELIKLIP